ncbi:hypothetical protein BKA70DRAFT_1428200 [Coprinopsis sp. MPI-PUGE-AT-0042]|nr:hypothetical protein BKA70DRAFT_1428200 [Coprinopsis sp. MPI-PUGE-AT-0042]
MTLAQRTLSSGKRMLQKMVATITASLKPPATSLRLVKPNTNSCPQTRGILSKPTGLLRIYLHHGHTAFSIAWTEVAPSSLDSLHLSKRGFSRLLDQAREVWEARKRRRIEKRQASHAALERGTHPPEPAAVEPLIEPIVHGIPPIEDNQELANEQPVEVDQPIAVRKSARNRKLPARYRENAAAEVDAEEDDLPEPLAPLNHPDMLARIPEVEGGLEHQPLPTPPARPKRWWFSQRNKFSLWRRYYATNPPSRDPERSVAPGDLDDSRPPQATPLPATEGARRYGPFENISSLLLADFWWNSENEKSKNEFTKLLKVLQDPSFSLEDIVSTDWGKLESALGDDDDDDG